MGVFAEICTELQNCMGYTCTYKYSFSEENSTLIWDLGVHSSKVVCHTKFLYYRLLEFLI